MRHLCVDARLYNGGGIGTYIKSLLPFLTDFELTLLVKEPIDFPARQIAIKSPIYTIQEQLELPQKIPSCDLFWSPHYNIPILPIRAKKRIVTIHDVYHLAHPLPLLQKLYAKLVINSALRLSDCVITVSHFSASEIERYCFKPTRLEIVPCCPLVNVPACIPAPDFLLFVGTNKPHKNFDRLREAHSLLKNPPPLVAVGKSFRPVTDEELASLYSTATLFCFPSTYEGFGIPPLEAMRCGCPVLAGKTGATLEVCGEAVEYVDPFSVISIKEGLERLLWDQKRRNELIQKGYERVKEYTPEKMAEKFLKVLNG